MSNRTVPFCPCIHAAPFSPCGTIVGYYMLVLYMETPEITDEELKKYAVEIDGVFYFAKAFASPSIVSAKSIHDSDQARREYVPASQRKVTIGGARTAQTTTEGTDSEAPPKKKK